MDLCNPIYAYIYGIDLRPSLLYTEAGVYSNSPSYEAKMQISPKFLLHIHEA